LNGAGVGTIKTNGVLSATSTTSTSWVDTGESLNVLQTVLGKKEIH